jgi:acyl-coenzyme A thioesterase PaaI-like protein
MSSMVARDGESSLDVPDDWLQGRTLFGGLQAAIALAAMRSLVPDAPLRTLQATFLAPVGGGTVRAKARILRSGKSATYVESRLVEGDQTLAVVVGFFGVARDSKVALHMKQPTVMPDKPVEMRYVEGAMPAFTQHFKARWIEGAPPYTGDRHSENVIELGLRDTGNATESHAVAMADFIPPIALSWMTDRVAAATVTWMLELLVTDFSSMPLDGWRMDATMMAAGGGYTNQSMVLWGPGGVPVALGRQTMVVFG